MAVDGHSISSKPQSESERKKKTLVECQDLDKGGNLQKYENKYYTNNYFISLTYHSPIKCFPVISDICVVFYERYF